MEVHQLEYTLAVAKHQSFTRAAAEICVTPSSLSQQIKKLEEELGVPLFERTTRFVVLTPAGREFLIFAKRIITDIHESAISMREYVSVDSGHLTIGFIPAMGSFGLTALIASFQKTYPKIKLSFSEHEDAIVLDMLDNATIDVAFCTSFEKQKPTKTVLENHPIVSSELVLLTSTLHPFAKRQIIDLREAMQEKFIFVEPTSGLYIDAIDACQSAGFSPNIVYKSASIDTILGLVAEEMGITLFSHCVATSHSRTDLATVRFRPTILRTVNLLHRKFNLSPSVANFRNFCLQWSRIRHLPPNSL